MGDVAPFGFALLIRDLDEVLVDDLGHGDFLAALSALGFHADASLSALLLLQYIMLSAAGL